jgi:predicted transposase YdaD
MKYDNPLKEILQESTPALLGLLRLPRVTKLLTVELPRRNRVVPDLVAELADASILHMELQAKNQTRFEWRCLDYYSAIEQLYSPPEIIQVVIYVGSEPLRMPDRIQRKRLSYRYGILNLQEVPARVFLDSPNEAERILAVLCQTRDPRRTIRQMLGSWKHLSRKQIEELLRKLSVLSQLRNCGTIVQEEVGQMAFEIDITQNVFYKAAVERGLREGMEKGLEKGLERGEAKALLRFLEQRFRKVSPSIRKRVSTANVQELERWIDRAATATKLTDVFSAS